ncbi:response regulator [Spirosoma gilvum]
MNHPIIFIDDDEDDQVIFEPLLQKIAPQTPILFFTDGQQAIDYLRTTSDRPFLIISEVSMNIMSGLELRRQIETDSQLRKRAIPFIFFTHPAYKHLVEEAYELTIQGFFEKKQNVSELESQLQAIVAYWSNCLHPNRYSDTDY